MLRIVTVMYIYLLLMQVLFKFQSSASHCGHLILVLEVAVVKVIHT